MSKIVKGKKSGPQKARQFCSGCGNISALSTIYKISFDIIAKRKQGIIDWDCKLKNFGINWWNRHKREIFIDRMKGKQFIANEKIKKWRKGKENPFVFGPNETNNSLPKWNTSKQEYRASIELGNAFDIENVVQKWMNA